MKRLSEVACRLSTTLFALACIALVVCFNDWRIVQAENGCYPEAEKCHDGIDNDCDGRVDCEDPDCYGDIDWVIDVPDLEQDEPVWADEIYGFTEYTIGDVGCHLTALAMILNYYGPLEDPSTLSPFYTDPSLLNTWLKSQADGYINGSLVNNAAVARYARIHNVGLYYHQPLPFSATANEILQSSVCVGEPQLLRVDGGGHAVVATGRATEHEWYIRDPAGDRDRIDTYSSIRVFSTVPAGLSRFWVSGHSPIELILVDSMGRKTGFDPVLNQQFDDIPGCQYYASFITGNMGHSIPEAKIIECRHPLDGTYKVQVTGTGAGPYTTVLYSYDREGNPIGHTFTGTTEQDQVTDYEVGYSSMPVCEVDLDGDGDTDGLDLAQFADSFGDPLLEPDVSVHLAVVGEDMTKFCDEFGYICRVAGRAAFEMTSLFSHSQGDVDGPYAYLMVAGAYVDTEAHNVYLMGVLETSGEVDVPLNRLPGWDDFGGNTYVGTFPAHGGYEPPGPAWEKSYTFFVDENDNGVFDLGESTDALAIPSGSIQRMGLVQDVEVTGDKQPTFSWSLPSEGNPGWYRVMLFPLVGGNPDISDLLFRTDPIEADPIGNSYTYTGDLFDTYSALAFAIEAYDSAYTGEYNPFANRSRYVGEHYTVDHGPAVSDCRAWTEKYGPNTIPGFPSDQWMFKLEAEVVSPADIDTVWAFAQTPEQDDYQLSFRGPEFQGSYNWAFMAPYTDQMGVWEVVAKDVNQDQDGMFTHTLDNPIEMPCPGGISFSDTSTTPTVSWNPVYYDDDSNAGTADVEADGYRIGLISESGDSLFYVSNWSMDTSLAIPAGLIQSGQRVFVAVYANDIDVRTENRSVAFEEFTAD